ncbi:MAG TPA: hypothetical protein PKY87_15595 [Terricaulis sp.]|nr:hypothetical protein [Terricaulis sp.]
MWPQFALGPVGVHRWTRILCSILVLTAIVLNVMAAAAFVTFALLMVSRDDIFHVYFMNFLFALVAVSVVVVIVGGVLYLWRKCEQCAYRLYNAFDRRLLWPEVQRGFLEPPRAAHPAAERLFASYAYGVIWSKARRGVAHCPWCGHADKLKAEYDLVQ